jgi:hypothetical protein
MRAQLALAVFLAGTLVYGCGGFNDPSQNTNSDFTDTLVPLEVNVHEFDARRNGEFTANLIAIAPTQSSRLGVALGNVANGVCNPYTNYINNVSTFNRLALSGPINEGHYCIQVYDLGFITEQQTYTLRVSHP